MIPPIRPTLSFGISRTVIFLALLFLFCASTTTRADNISPQGGLEAASLYWLQNMGQAPKGISFHKKTFMGNIAITENNTIVYTQQNKSGRPHVFSEQFVSGNSIVLLPKGKAQVKVNYIAGTTPESPNHAIPAYHELLYANVWKGIDIALLAKTNNVEKVFTIHPHANINNISIAVNGAKLKCSKNGELLLSNRKCQQIFTAPIAWQVINGMKVDRKVSYKLKGKRKYGFNVQNYDPMYTLYIDPLLASTIAPGSEGDFKTNRIVRVDNADNIIIAYQTASFYLPVTPRAYQQGIIGDFDLAICKFNPNLSTLLACTYIGGDGHDRLLGMDLDKTNNIYLVNGSLIYKLNANLENVLSSYLMNITSTSEFITGFDGLLAIDQNGFVFYTNTTKKQNLSIGGNSFQNYFSGSGSSSFIYKFPPDLSAPAAFTYLSAHSVSQNNFVHPLQLSFDKDNNPVVSGDLKGAANFPTTSDAFMRIVPNSDPLCVYITKLSNDLSTLLSSTILDGGANKSDYLNDLAINSKNEIIITGRTASPNFPVTSDAKNPIIINSWAADFIAKFSADLTQLIYASGIPNNEYRGELISLNIDKSDNVYIGKATAFGIDEVFSFSYDSSFNGGTADGYIQKLSPDLKHTLAATYIGGDLIDAVTDLQFNSLNQVVASGRTQTLGFPFLANSYYTTPDPTYKPKAFIVILDSLLSNLQQVKYNAAHLYLCEGDTALLSSLIHPAKYAWTTGDDKQSIEVVDTGIYVCQSYTDAILFIDSFYVHPFTKPNLISIHDTYFCHNTPLFISAYHPFFKTYLWNTTQTDSIIKIAKPGIYSVIAKNNGCTVLDTIIIDEKPLPVITSLRDTAVCFDQIAQILLDAGAFKSYLWKPTGETTQTIYSTKAMVYQLTVTDSNNCVTDKRVAVMETCPYYLFVPNAFTPNGDGLNDVFLPESRSLTYYELNIVNRWGEIVFTTKNPLQGWDGKDAASDVYVVSIHYKVDGSDILSLTKNVTLLR